MLKRLRFKLMVMMASLGMLALIGFSSNKAWGQSVCPGVPFPIGLLKLGVSTTSNFTNGLLGTLEQFSGVSVAGLDWMFNDSEDGDDGSTEVGTQLISWWSQANGRNSIIQVTNTNDFGGGAIHVQILDSDCVELRDFCDVLTKNDTVVYDLAGIIDNSGNPVPSANLQGKEGIIVITAVDSCSHQEAAPNANDLQGNLRMLDLTKGIDEYGVNMFARPADFFGTPDIVDDIKDGKFKKGTTGGTPGPDWFVRDGFKGFQFGVTNFTPAIIFPFDPIGLPSLNALFITTHKGGTSTYSSSGFAGATNLATNDFFGDGGDSRVTTVEQKFTSTGTGSIRFDVAFLTSDDPIANGDYFIARVIAPNNNGSNGTVVSEFCISTRSGKSIAASKHGATSGTFIRAGNTICVFPPNPNIGPLDGNGYSATDGSVFGSNVSPESGTGKTGFDTLQKLFVPGTGPFIIQFIVGHNADNTVDLIEDTGAIVTNVFKITEVIIPCTSLTGSTGCKLEDLVPSVLEQHFSIIDADPAGADLVLMSLIDSYGPPYAAVPGSATYSPTIFDDNEHGFSCTAFRGCFVRTGVDDKLKNSDGFTPVTPTPPVKPTPTPIACGTGKPPCPSGRVCSGGVCVVPTPAPPTPTPGKGGGCSIGGPAELGTAMANILVPLVPAFAIGLRTLRRRQKKNEKNQDSK
jgi:hypothetical protein